MELAWVGKAILSFESRGCVYAYILVQATKAQD
jgi:hypothetical protein